MGNDGTIGVESDKVEKAIEELEFQKNSLMNWLMDMDSLKTKVADGWSSKASLQFEASCSSLNEDMASMCDAVQAFKNWARDTNESYALMDDFETNRMEAI